MLRINKNVSAEINSIKVPDIIPLYCNKTRLRSVDIANPHPDSLFFKITHVKDFILEPKVIRIAKVKFCNEKKKRKIFAPNCANLYFFTHFVTLQP